MAVAEIKITDEPQSLEARQMKTASEFLTALFEPDDLVIIRLIEAWTEGGKKKSRVDYKLTGYYKISPDRNRFLSLYWTPKVEQEFLNVYFGVCPRFGRAEQFDLEWQIRKVVTLWTDIDNVSVEEALQRVADAKLPPPRLSPSASFIKDILAGIAKTIGGDHTIDLSRLLRLPGSLNRKDQRNGKTPVPTELVRCVPGLRYPLSMFEPFKVESVTTERAKKVSAMPLPTVRKPTNAKQDRLAQLIAASEIAATGQRSEADFAVCCYAIEQGFDAESVWSRVETIGKFAEGGKRYFDLTWKNASYNAQEVCLDKILDQKSTKKGNAPQNEDEDSSGNSSGKEVITIDESTTFVGETLSAVTNCMIATGGCCSRADQTVFIHDDKILSILNSAELAGLLNQFVEFCIETEKKSEYKPFPTSYSNTWLNNHIELSRLPLIKAYVHNPVYSEDWRLIAPGYDKQTCIYYAGDAIEPRADTTHIDALLRDFCFKTPRDRTNYLGMMLTMVLIPRFIGSKPATLFNGNQPELGKTILAQILAVLRDGRRTETISYNPNDEEFEKRLGAHVRRGKPTRQDEHTI